MEPILDEATQRLRDAQTPPLPESLVRQAADSLRAAAAAAAAAAATRRRQHLRALSGLAAAAVLVVAAGVAWLAPNGGDLVFADVAARVEQAHSLVADSVIYHYGKDGRATTQPNGTIFVKGPRVRHEFHGGDKLVNVTDRSTGEYLELNTAGRSAVLRRYASDPFDMVTWLREIRDVATKPLGERHFDGKRLVGFTGVFERKLRDGTIDRGPTFVAWVDPAAKLPVRVATLDEQGRELHAMENIRFDVPLDDALFDLTPPLGFALRDERGVTPAQLRPPATAEEAATFSIVPGESIGGVKFGDSRAQILAAFGEPEAETRDEPRSGWARLDYPSRGMSLTLGPEGGLRKVWAFSAVRRGVIGHDFPGKTDRGIGIRSTGAALVAAHGEPDVSNPRPDHPDRVLTYKRLGLRIALNDDTVSSITATAPGGMGIAIPLSDDTRRLAEAMVLTPGVGLDGLKLGSTREQAIAALGQPEDPNSGDLQYPALGLSLNYDKQGRLKDVWATNPRDRERDGNGFAGRTDRGARLGSTREEVEALYGAADEVEGPPAEQLKLIPPSEVITYLNYDRFGLMVGLRGGVVTTITIGRPKQSATAPTSQRLTR